MKSIFITTFIVAILIGMDVLADEGYVLKEGDVINISVWGEDTLNKTARVLPDGSVSFPLAGTFSVLNMSANQVEKKIAKKLKEFISEPHVSVVIEATEGNRIFVLGKVLQPGAIVMTTPMTVSQALSLSGGLNKFAEDDNITILRSQSDKGKKRLSVKYSDIISGKDFSTNHQLKAGDTILVP